ncbi:unnamed protein product, partial [Sphacelaria rigidula]
MAASTQTQTMVEVEPKENSDSRGDAAGGGTLSKTASWIQPTSSGAVAGSLGGGHKQQQQQQRLSSWMPGKLSECGQWLEVGSQDSDEAKMRVVNQMLSAVRNACEG